MPIAAMRPSFRPTSALTMPQWSRMSALVTTVSTALASWLCPIPSRITLPPPNLTSSAVRKDDKLLHEFFDQFFLDCQRWGADGAEYKALTCAKHESLEARGARMGLKTMAQIAGEASLRAMGDGPR